MSLRVISSLHPFNFFFFLVITTTFSTRLVKADLDKDDYIYRYLLYMTGGGQFCWECL